MKANDSKDMAIFTNGYSAKTSLTGCFGHTDLDYEKVTYWSESSNNAMGRRCSLSWQMSPEEAPLTDWASEQSDPLVSPDPLVSSDPLVPLVDGWNVGATCRSNNWKQVKHVGRNWRRRFYTRYISRKESSWNTGQSNQTIISKCTSKTRKGSLRIGCLEHASIANQFRVVAFEWYQKIDPFHWLWIRFGPAEFSSLS